MRKNHTCCIYWARRTPVCKTSPLRIKPVGPDYMVPSLDESVHSPFGGRKPQRREDRSKRARRFSQNRCSTGRHLPLALLGKEASKEGGHNAETRTTARMKQGLTNPTLEGLI
jgi:hypothetical protein